MTFQNINKSTFLLNWIQKELLIEIENYISFTFRIGKVFISYPFKILGNTPQNFVFLLFIHVGMSDSVERWKSCEAAGRVGGGG